MDKTNAAYPIYEAVSTAAYNSGLTHAFSYEIAKRAADILAENDWTDDDLDATDAIDAAVPIYTAELMTMYAHNWDAIDAANNETGTPTVYDSVQAARVGWYSAIDSMCRAIIENLNKLRCDACHQVDCKNHDCIPM